MPSIPSDPSRRLWLTATTVFVLRRTHAMIEALAGYGALLADPGSQWSEQPKSSRDVPAPTKFSVPPCRFASEFELLIGSNI